MIGIILCSSKITEMCFSWIPHWFDITLLPSYFSFLIDLGREAGGEAEGRLACFNVLPSYSFALFHDAAHQSFFYFYLLFRALVCRSLPWYI